MKRIHAMFWVLLLLSIESFSQSTFTALEVRYNDIEEFVRSVSAQDLNKFYESDYLEKIAKVNIEDLKYEFLRSYRNEKALLYGKYEREYNEGIRLGKNLQLYDVEAYQEIEYDINELERIVTLNPANVDDSVEVFIRAILSTTADEYLGVITPDDATLGQIRYALSELRLIVNRLNQSSSKFEGINDTLKLNMSLVLSDIENIDQKIAEKLAPIERQMSFNSKIILLFAILIAVMIISFFATIYFKSEDPVVISLLSNEGLQFVTIFVLIIAIVLFGTLEILEGRELAAIISGISGYILGRRTSEKKLDPDTVLQTIVAKKSGQTPTVTEK